MKLLKQILREELESEKEEMKMTVKKDMRTFRRGFALGVCVTGCGCLLYLHRNVIRAAVTGAPMPQPPKWHFWCRREAEEGDNE